MLYAAKWRRSFITKERFVLATFSSNITYVPFTFLFITGCRYTRQTITRREREEKSEGERERDGYYLIQRLGLPEQYIRDVPFPPRLALHVHLVVQRVLEVDRARRLLLPQRLIGLPIGALAGPRFGHHLLLLLLHPFPLLLGERDRLLVGQHHGWKKAEKKGVVKGEDRFKARGGKIYSRSSQ